MGRWLPDSRGRLIQAAMELYAERGFEQTTVAEIAERAGLTERTFFRQFADKREALFAGSEQLSEFLVEHTVGAPPETPPLEAIAAAVEALSDEWFSDPVHSRQRQAIIDSHRSLQEREIMKMVGLGADLAGALRTRGVPEPAATITAEAGILIFRTAFARWVAEGNEQPFAEIVVETRDALKAATAA